VLNRKRKIDGHHGFTHLATIKYFEVGDLFGLSFDQSSELFDDAAPVWGGHPSPR
jgi:hypothetical protein